MTKEEKQKAIDALKISTPVVAVTQEEFEDYIQTLNKIMDWLKQEPRKGKWLSQREHCKMYNLIPSGLGSYFWCSECNHAVDVMEWHRNHYNYCPNCGARMVEPQESEKEDEKDT